MSALAVPQATSTAFIGALVEDVGEASTIGVREKV